MIDYYNTFLEVLSSVEESEIKSMPVSLALRCLEREVRASGIGRGICTAAQEGRQFYSTDEDVQTSPFQGMGHLSEEDIDVISKIQKREDANITANIQGKGNNVSVRAGRLHTGLHVSQQSPQTINMPAMRWQHGPEMRLEMEPFASYVDVALAVTRTWQLNKLQPMVLLQPAAFLDKQGTRLQEAEAKQHFQYVGGEGGPVNLAPFSLLRTCSASKTAYTRLS